MSRILTGDALYQLSRMPAESVDCIITSPPYYGLRDYGMKGQLGLEETVDEYVAHLVEVFRLAYEVLKDDGTLWLNIGDSYATHTKNGMQGKNGERATRAFTPGKLRAKRIPGLPNKSLIGIPWKVAFALQEAGWLLRQDIIWHKPNAMPESMKDRCTRAHEYVFLFSKGPRYHFDTDAIRTEPKAYKLPEDAEELSGRRKSSGPESGSFNLNGGRGRAYYKAKYHPKGATRRSVWSIGTQSFPGAHFATFPPKLVELMVLAGCREGGTVLDPFLGSGTTAVVAKKLGRQYIGIELNPEYVAIARERIKKS